MGQGRRVCVSAADRCRCLRRDPPPRRRAAAACARRRLVDDSSRARRAAPWAAWLWSESSRVEITKSANFEVARESLEMVPRRSPGAGASRRRITSQPRGAGSAAQSSSRSSGATLSTNRLRKISAKTYEDTDPNEFFDCLFSEGAAMYAERRGGERENYL